MRSNGVYVPKQVLLLHVNFKDKKWWTLNGCDQQNKIAASISTDIKVKTKVVNKRKYKEQMWKKETKIGEGAE